jgi:guanylate kinase
MENKMEEVEEKGMSADKSSCVKRSEWEIKDDCRAVKNALQIFKDPERLEEVKEMMKKKRDDEKNIDALLEGDLKKALGL